MLSQPPLTLVHVTVILGVVSILFEHSFLLLLGPHFHTLRVVVIVGIIELGTVGIKRLLTILIDKPLLLGVELQFLLQGLIVEVELVDLILLVLNLGCFGLNTV